MNETPWNILSETNRPNPGQSAYLTDGVIQVVGYYIRDTNNENRDNIWFFGSELKDFKPTHWAELLPLPKPVVTTSALTET